VAHSDAAPLHGLTFLKGCQGTTTVGNKTMCDFTVSNSIDQDTLTITSLVDTVHGGNGEDTSANVLPLLDLAFTNGASCDADQNICTLPPGSKLRRRRHSPSTRSQRPTSRTRTR